MIVHPFISVSALGLRLGSRAAAVANILGWLALLAYPVFCVAIVKLRRRLLAESAAKSSERRRREELESYQRLGPAPLDPSHATHSVESMREMAKQVCRTITEKSVFPSAALLLKNAEGRLYCAGSCGVDDLTITALLVWGEQVVIEERNVVSAKPDSGIRPAFRSGSFEAAKAGARAIASKVARHGNQSFTVPIGTWDAFDPEASRRKQEGKRERRRWRRSVITPMRTPGGRLVGVIAVFADDSGRRGAIKVPAHGTAYTESNEGSHDRIMGPIEALAIRLAAAIEGIALAERLLRAEKLAGLGQLAGGVAHALNNPLTAVLGFAELIEETTSDPRVQRDALTIRAEAHKMRETVQSLLNFWRPVTLADEPVNIAAVVRELAEACTPTLAERGVQLIVSTSPELPPISGSRERLRQVLEHLLNNAAQAIASVSAAAPESGHVIRLTATCDQRTLNLIVSDTGTGFREPGRVFDPFYTTRPHGEGTGLGLSLCYGIVREHGGEISAFNLQPQGAAVVVELPLRKLVANDGEDRVLLRTQA